MAYDDPTTPTESIPAVLGRVVDDVRELVREELALARVELQQEASAFAHSAIDMAAAAAFGGFAALFVLLGIAQAGARWLGIGIWAAYLLMGIVLGIAAGIALLMSRQRMKQTRIVPPRTAASLQETREWISRRTTSSAR